MTSGDFKFSITARHKLMDLHLKETLHYRDLIFLFVKRDFTAAYKQTILGPLWAIIQPLLTTIVFTVVFGNLAGLTTSDVAGDFVVPSFLFYLSGSIIWSYFSTNLTSNSSTFLANSGVMGKVYFPRLVMPISTAFSKLISFGIQFAMLICIWLYYLIKGGTSICVSPMLLLVPLLVIQMMMLSTGIGIIVSSLTTKYRDLNFLVGFALQLWQYGCPVAYGLGLIPEKYLKLYTMVNPVTPIITTFRYALMGFGYFDLVSYLVSWGVTVVLFFVGVIIFSRIERTFMDTI